MSSQAQAAGFPAAKRRRPANLRNRNREKPSPTQEPECEDASAAKPTISHYVSLSESDDETPEVEMATVAEPSASSTQKPSVVRSWTPLSAPASFLPSSEAGESERSCQLKFGGLISHVRYEADVTWKDYEEFKKTNAVCTRGRTISALTEKELDDVVGFTLRGARTRSKGHCLVRGLSSMLTVVWDLPTGYSEVVRGSAMRTLECALIQEGRGVLFSEHFFVYSITVSKPRDPNVSAAGGTAGAVDRFRILLMKLTPSAYAHLRKTESVRDPYTGRDEQLYPGESRPSTGLLRGYLDIVAGHFWNLYGKVRDVVARLDPDVSLPEDRDSCVQSTALSLSRADPKDSDTLNHTNRALLKEVEERFGNGFRVAIASRRARYLEAVYFSEVGVWNTCNKLLQGHALRGTRFKAGGYRHSAAVASGSDDDAECWNRGGYEKIVQK